MRKLLALLCVLAAASTAQAQPAPEPPVESVTAHGNSLVGVWRVSNPTYVAMAGFFSPLKWGPPRENFCRIAPQKDDLAMFCGDRHEAATVTAEDNHVHFAWGTMMLRLAIDGELESVDHFRGHFQIKLSGITYENPTFSEAVRLTPDATVPDRGGKAGLLRQILGQGLSSVPHDDAAMKKNEAAGDLSNLGAVNAVTYLDQETRWGSPPLPPGAKPYPNYIPDQPDFFSVYFVRFADGERLCGLHQRDDGVLDAFRCV